MGFAERLYTFRNDGRVVANTAAETSLFPSGKRKSIPAAYFTRDDADIVNEYHGKVSHLASASLTFNVRFSGALVWTSGAITLPASVKTNVPFTLRLRLTGSTIGDVVAGKIIGTGEYWQEGALVAKLAVGAAPGTEGGGFDMEDAHKFDILAVWGAANAGNSIQVLQGSPDIVT